MPAIISYLLGKFSFSSLWYAFYIATQLTIIGFMVAFVLWVVQILLTAFNMLDSLFTMVTTAGNDSLGSQIFGMLDCLGVIDGINAGLPILLTSFSSVLLYFLYTHMSGFYLYISDFLKGLKPS